MKLRNYSGGNRSDRGRDFGKRRGKDSGRPSMHQTKCNHCGIACEVPFKPTSGKPIYCSKCFENNQNEEPKKYGRDRGDKRSRGGGDSRNRSFNDRESTIHAKDKEIDQLKKEIKILNKKVDKVLDILKEVLSTKGYHDDDE